MALRRTPLLVFSIAATWHPILPTRFNSLFFSSAV